MVYGRSKPVPPPATPFEEFMATASEKMTAARLDFVEFLREMPPAAWIAIGVVVMLLAASSLNWRGKKEAPVEPAATTNAVADVAAPSPDRRVDLHAIDATPAWWRVAMSVPHRSMEPVRPRHVQPTHWLISTQVDAPPVSMEVIDQAAELTKGKVAEGGAATDDAVKNAVVGPAQ